MCGLALHYYHTDRTGKKRDTSQKMLHFIYIYFVMLNVLLKHLLFFVTFFRELDVVKVCRFVYCCCDLSSCSVCVVLIICCSLLGLRGFWKFRDLWGPLT